MYLFYCLYVLTETIVGFTAVFLLEQEVARNKRAFHYRLTSYQSDGLLLLKHAGLTSLSLGWVIATRL